MTGIDYIYFMKEENIAAWGWYWNNSVIEKSKVNEFVYEYISLCLRYGIFLPTFILNESLEFNAEKVQKRLFDIVNQYEGNLIQKSLTYMYYSESKGTHIIPSYIYENSEKQQLILQEDHSSTIICTLKKKNFHSYYFEMKTDMFYTFYEDPLLFKANVMRFNSFLAKLHLLFENYGCDVFAFDDYIKRKCFNEKGLFVSRNDDRIFYEDVYGELSSELRFY